VAQPVTTPRRPQSAAWDGPDDKPTTASIAAAETSIDFITISPEFGTLYAQACEKRVEAMENDLLEIADDTDRDYREGKNGQEIPNKEVVLRSKVRIEARQWLMSRRDPKQWGDKSSVDVSANIMLLSPEERVQKALQLFDLTEKFVERARKPVGGGPLVYDPGDDSLPLLVVPRQTRGFGRD
jgi:hypothetical protein